MKRLIFLALALFMLSSAPAGASISEQISPEQVDNNQLSYSGLVELVAQQPEKISKVKLVDNNQIEVFFADESKLDVYYPAKSQIVKTLEESKIPIWVAQDPADSKSTFPFFGGFIDYFSSLGLIRFLVSLFLALLFVGGLVAYGRKKRRAREAAYAEAEAEADDVATNIPNVSFSDIAGCDEVIEEVSECSDYLASPDTFHELGAKMPSGIILFGPPGTGKTLLAKAVANSAGVAFYSMSGSEFVEKYVGVGAGRVRDLFEKAKQHPAAVIFIDELDSLAGKRGSLDSNNSEEREVTLTELLTRMDGFEENDNLLIIGATNRLDRLDPAVLRSGRFSRQIEVPLPVCQGRLDILNLYAKKKPLGKGVDLARFAEITAGLSGADIADVLNEAAIHAARNKADSISMDDLEEAYIKSIAGPERKHSSLSKEERVVVAYHEAGHALAAELCGTHDKIQKVTIRPRNNGAGGLALYGRTDKSLYNMNDLHEKLVVLLGGRAAEIVSSGVVTSGAQNDLVQASKIARTAVEQFGFSTAVGQIIHDRQIGMSEQSRQMVDSEVERLVSEAYDSAVLLIKEHREDLTSIADLLLEKEVIDRNDLLKVTDIKTTVTPKRELKQRNHKEIEESKEVKRNLLPKIKAAPDKGLAFAKSKKITVKTSKA